jgi:glycosidase
MADDPQSMLHLYRRLIALRRSLGALAAGDQLLLDTPRTVVGWQRLDPGGDTDVTVLVNFTDRVVDLDMPGVVGLTTLVSSDNVGEGDAFSGSLGANQAVVLAGRT